jgi:hypothetical protein
MRRLREGYVGHHISVEVQADRADVKRSDVGKEEEVLFLASPLAKDIYSFVLCKRVRVIFDVAGLHW